METMQLNPYYSQIAAVTMLGMSMMCNIIDIVMNISNKFIMIIMMNISNKFIMIIMMNISNRFIIIMIIMICHHHSASQYSNRCAM